MQYNSLVELLIDNNSNSQLATYTYYRNGDTPDESVTSTKLCFQAKLLARWMIDNGLAKQRILLTFGPGLEFIEVFLACQFANAIAVPVVPCPLTGSEHKVGRLISILRDCQPALVLGTQRTVGTSAQFISNYPEFSGIRWVALEELDLTSSLSDFHISVPNGKDLALLQYTSGSTSMPKGVMLSHSNLLSNLAHFDEDWNHSPGSTLVSWLPHFHDLGLVYGTLFPIYKGINGIILPPTSVVQQPIRWLRAISKTNATHSMGPNFIYDLCLKRISDEDCVGLDLSSWRMALNAAEPIRMETIRNFTSRFSKYGFPATTLTGAWGLAESTCLVTGQAWKEPPRSICLSTKALSNNQLKSPEENELYSEFVSCGEPSSGMEIKIVHGNSLIECAHGEVGEIWLRGPTVAQGYWNRPLETKTTFGARLNDDLNDNAYMRTGDIGFLDNDELFICGRMKDMIIIRGENYYPQDIELAVEVSHPAFKESCCAVFGIEQAKEERIVVIQELIRHHDRWSTDDMFQAIRRAISLTNDLPVESIVLIRPGTTKKTSSGKIQRNASKLAYLNETLAIISRWDRSITTKQTPTRKITDLACIEADLISRLALFSNLAAESIDLTSPFADLGLGSLGATILSGELAKYYKIPLSPTAFYDFPHIKALTSHIASLLKINIPQVRSDFKKEIQVHPIAVVGMACRFPGAPTLADYWSLLEKGKSGISKCLHNNGQSSYGGFIENISSFDHEFFGITRREAACMDPQQRITLQIAWQAMEDAGIHPKKLAGKKIGVFIGASAFDYGAMQLSSGQVDAYSAQGSLLAVIANRIAYQFDFRGPSLVVDTACSSALTAIHLARRSLSDGECDIALAGGVNALLATELNSALNKAGMLSPDGSCKTFDATANGYVRAEGCGILVLKRSDEAQADGDRVYGTLLSSTMAQDGRSNGLTAPNGLAQEELLRESLHRAGIRPTDLQYIEAHGTGTPLGDPIECNALARVMNEQKAPCYIGSVKANVGHLEAAAGIAGMIKVLLALHHEIIPQQINFTRLNPAIQMPQAMRIPQVNQPWRKTTHPRYASVSAFGFAGTNVNIVVADTLTPSPQNDVPYHTDALPMVISAQDQTSLNRWSIDCLKILENDASIGWRQFLHTAACRRHHHKARFATVIDSQQKLIANLQNIAKEAAQNSTAAPPRIAFAYTGQGMPLRRVGHRLMKNLPEFREAIRQCAAVLNPIMGVDIETLLYQTEAVEEITAPEQVQPLHFALQYALTRTLVASGITPQLVLGHSLGEYMALVVAGSLAIEDALRLVAARGNLTQKYAPPGIMMVVLENERIVASIISEAGLRVDIAAINSYRHCVVAGSKQDTNKLSEQLTEHNISYKILPIERAYHSTSIEPVIEHLESLLSSCKFTAPQIPFISNVTGDTWPKNKPIDQTYLQCHMRQTVQFAKSLDTLATANIDIVIEIGSSAILADMARIHLGDQGPNWVTILRHGKSDDWSALLHCLTQIWTHGYSVNWSNYFTADDRLVVSLPPYCFGQETHWFCQQNNKYHPRSTNKMDNMGVISNSDIYPEQQIVHHNDKNSIKPVKERIKDLLGRLLREKPSTLQTSTSLMALGVDSIILLEFSRMLKKEFSIEITPLDIFEKYQSIDSISEYLEARLKQIEIADIYLPTESNDRC